MITFDQGALRVTLSNLRRVGATEPQIAQRACKEAGTVLHAKIKQNISLTDHSLDDLRDLDHPYARRHGGIRIHAGGSTSLKTPSNRVHKQSGDLLAALHSEQGPATPGWRVWLDAGAAPQAAFVVLGTRVMLPRDVLWDTAEGRLTQKDMLRAIVRVLGKEFRTQGSMRVGGGGVGPGKLGV